MNKEEIEEIETLEIDFKDTDELELALEVSSKKAIYLINDLIKHLFELQQENQSLKKENKILRENAENNDKVVDKVNWENLKLKEQLEEYKRLGFKHLNDKCNKLENQQKEFIEYLNSYIKLLSDDPDYIEERQKDILEEILSKYEEIIYK